jgi:hypothetical protein
MAGSMPQAPGWVHALIYRTFAALDEVMQAAGVPYTAAGGTLLGAIRHHGVIPWDDDGDLAIRHDDLQAVLERAGPVFDAEGFGLIHRFDDMLKVYPLEGRLTTDSWRYPFVDIWPMSTVDGRWVPSSEHERRAWPDEFLEADSFETVRRVPFGLGELSIAAEPVADRYLETNFGPDWRTEHVYYGFHDGDPRAQLDPPASVRDTRRPRRADGLELQEIRDGLVIYQHEPPRVHHLNHTAALLFALCTGEQTVDEIVAYLQHGYGLDHEPVQETSECIERLREEGVLVVA